MTTTYPWLERYVRKTPSLSCRRISISVSYDPSSPYPFDVRGPDDNPVCGSGETLEDALQHADRRCRELAGYERDEAQRTLEELEALSDGEEETHWCVKQTYEELRALHEASGGQG